jgi:hypothetical protein
MSWLDSLFLGYQTIAVAGVPLPPETTLNFSSGATGSDNPSGGSTNIALSSAGGGAAQPITTAGTFSVAPGAAVSVNLSAAGGNVTLSPTGFGAGQSFSVKLIGPAASYSVLINPQSGGQIEQPTTPGTLGSSAYPINGAAAPTGTPGYGISFRSYDGVNLYYS